MGRASVVRRMGAVWMAMGVCPALWSCAPGRSTIVVTVQTDLLPGYEFVEVVTDAVSQQEERGATADEDWYEGQRVGEFDVEPGVYDVRVVLVGPSGEVALERTVRARVEGDVAITVVLTRDCRGVSCPAGDGDIRATECLGGRCVPPDCVEGTENECAIDASECEEDTQCDDPLGECARGRCLGGFCVSVVDSDGVCGEAELCVPELGCVTDECDADEQCSDVAACYQAECSSGRCRYRPRLGCETGSCDDAFLNQDESDVDCGGVCDACGDGLSCRDADDCESAVCLNAICRPISCTDGRVNGTESDVDCGGAACPACAAEAACGVPADCESLDCADGTCAPSRCDDSLRNGAEEGVDCGGPCPDCLPLCLTQTAVPIHECLALVSLYVTNEGPGWVDDSGWLVDLDVCAWTGVTCDSGHVSELDFTGQGVRGALAPAFFRLHSLERLDFTTNSITSLPPELGNLSALRVLVLQGNNLNTLPASLAELTQLISLNVSDNSIAVLPEEIFDLTELMFLFAADNPLVMLPPEIGNLSNLTWLWVNNCALASLPSEIGNIASLRWLDTRDNQLTELPAELGRITLLGELWVSDNLLTTIPPELGSFTAIQTLFLDNNQMVGDLPGALLMLSSLRAGTSGLRLSGNGCLTSSTPGLTAFLSGHDPNWTQGCVCHPTCSGSDYL